MRRSLCALLIAVACAPAARAEDDAKQLQGIVDKAIEALGGAKKLKQYPAFTVEGKGKVHVMGMALPYTSTSYIGGEDKLRVEISITAGDNTIEVVNVLNGEKGWTKINGTTRDFNKSELKSARDDMYINTLTHLLPLKQKGIKLSALGETKVGGKPAVGVRAESKGHPAVNLYFDKKTHLLVKKENQKLDPMSDMKYTEETVYGEFKKVDGLPTPHKITIKRDGELYVEATATSVKWSEKLDSDYFKKP